MTTAEVDTIIARLLPRVLADRELGNGRSFTSAHLRHLWALTCLQRGEHVDEAEFAEQVSKQLPPQVRLVREVATR
jgi:hypothetical protein